MVQREIACSGGLSKQKVSKNEFPIKFCLVSAAKKQV